MKFTDERIYLKGTCNATLRDKNGNVVYYSDKFQEANIATEVDAGEIRAGMGNGRAAIIPSNANLNVTFNAADFDLWAKIAQVGGTLRYNAPVTTCQDITATGEALAIDVSKGAPVAYPGYSDIFCYVQEINQPSPMAQGGIAYPLNAETGAVSDFTAVSGKKYKVWYCANQAGAKLGTVPSMIDPGVYHFTSRHPLFVNATGEANSGTRIGWLDCVVPVLKLGGTGGGIVGDQTNPDTTSISGYALAEDSKVIGEGCEDCAFGSNYAYYIFIPDVGADQVKDILVLGGVVSVTAGGSKQIPVQFVMKNGELVPVTDYSEGFTFEATAAPTGTSVSATGLVSAGSAAGDFDVKITYDNGDEDKPEFQTAVSVVSA